MSRRTVLSISVAVAVGALSALVSYFAFKPIGRAQGREWRPFTAVMVMRRYQRSSATVVGIENYIYARKSDGSWVRDTKRQIMPNGGWGDLRVVMDYSAATRTAVDPSTESVTIYHRDRNLIARLSTPPQVCSTGPTAKHAIVLAYDTIVVERTQSRSGGGGNKITEWRAPELNCFPLKQTIDDGSPGAWPIVSREALFVKEGEPSSGLFEISVGYIERSPSEVIAERARRFPDEQAAQIAPSEFDVFDEAYISSQKTR